RVGEWMRTPSPHPPIHPSTLKKQLQVAYRNSQRLLKLVNTLLDFSRIEAGRIEVVYEPTDLAMLTTDLAGVFRSAIDRAGMCLRVDCPPLPEPVYVDREMWEKIVLNLLSNAFKFTFEGEIAVVLRSGDDHIELVVQDTGTGIPAEELSHIFERFHQVKGARGRSYEGSGIGLSLVQELVRLHGGTIQVSSVVDQGTSFIVSIPTGFAHLPSERLRQGIACSPQEIAQRIGATRTLVSTATGAASYLEELLRWLPKSIESSGARVSELLLSVPVQPKPSSAPTMRILLADDNADMRDYLKRLLSQQYEVEAVADGVATLAAIRQQMPDLLLTDVMMPGLDGFELLRSLRTDPQTKELPIILLSARAGEESRIEGLEAGADDYLTKPFSARELLARIEATLKLAQMRQEATQREREMRSEVEAAYNQVNQILESMTDAFVALDQDWQIVYLNAAAERINGKLRTEVLGKTHWEEWPASVGTNVEHQYRRAMAEQISVHFEHHYYAPFLYDIWLDIYAYPFETGLGIFFRDITERKQAEEILRQSEARFQRLAANLPGVIYQYVLHPDGSDALTYVSPKCREIYELEPEVLLQDFGQVWAMIHPDDVERVHYANTTSTQRLESFDVKFRLIVPSGRLKWIQAISQPERQSNGDVIFDGLVMDITAHKQAEDRLRESEERFRTLADNIAQFAWIADETGWIFWYNRRWFDYTGTTLEEMEGWGWQRYTTQNTSIA
ncbi:MAG: response regulator, partial [Cyanobacteria bacterium CRU_2_1]|nr:response regulator [Cyanobacteria bacterium CRU_2_1]